MTSGLYLLQAASAASPSPPATGTTAEDRSTSFRPVEGGNQMQSGERLLVEAYAVIWFIVFAFVWLSWRRQARLDQRIVTLEDALRKARQSGES